MWPYILFAASACWLLFWRFFAFYCIERQAKRRENPPGITVLICARNAEKMLRDHLPQWLEQSFSPYELLLVDDASEDQTPELLQTLKSRYPHLRFIRVSEKKTAGKRAALLTGLEHCRYEQVVLTDADCRPSGPEFLEELAAQIGAQPVTYIGLGLYESGKTWVNAAIQYETIHAAYLYYPAAVLGFPYMGVGRNMGYARENGIRMVKSSIREGLAGGDDDLALRSGLGGKPICISGAQAWTVSMAPEDFKSWSRQKQRHMGTSTHYSILSLFWIGADYLSGLGMWLMSAYFLWLLQIGPVLVTFCVLLIQWKLYHTSLKRRRTEISVFRIFAGELICTFVLPVLWMQAISKKNRNRWT